MKSPRSGRLLEILQSLREARRPTSAAVMARRYDVSERTIYRDISTLISLGAPISGEPGVGYSLGPGFFLPPLSLSTIEANAVLLGLRYVTRRGDGEIAQAAISALAKIGEGVGPDAQREMLQSGLTVGPSQRPEARWLADVRNCLEKERKLHILYRDAGGRAEERTVWPVALGFFDHAEMLAAWCEKRDAFRHFRLDRIEYLQILEKRLPTARRLLLARYRLQEPGADL